MGFGDLAPFRAGNKMSPSTCGAWVGLMADVACAALRLCLGSWIDGGPCVVLSGTLRLGLAQLQKPVGKDVPRTPDCAVQSTDCAVRSNGVLSREFWNPSLRIRLDTAVLRSQDDWSSALLFN